VVWGDIERIQANTDTSSSRTPEAVSGGITYIRHDNSSQDFSSSSGASPPAPHQHRPGAAASSSSAAAAWPQGAGASGPSPYRQGPSGPAVQATDVNMALSLMSRATGGDDEDAGVGTSSGASSSGEGREGAMGADGASRARVPPDPEAQAAIERILSKHGMWSMGTATHGVGRCKPCNYFHSRGGCKVGAACIFCHIPHTSRAKSKPSSSLSMWRRVMCKRMTSALYEELGHDRETFKRVAAIVGSKSAHLRGLLDAALEGDVPTCEGLPQSRRIESL